MLYMISANAICVKNYYRLLTSPRQSILDTIRPPDCVTLK